MLKIKIKFLLAVYCTWRALTRNRLGGSYNRVGSGRVYCGSLVGSSNRADSGHDCCTADAFFGAAQLFSTEQLPGRLLASLRD